MVKILILSNGSEGPCRYGNPSITLRYALARPHSKRGKKAEYSPTRGREIAKTNATIAVPINPSGNMANERLLSLTLLR